MKQYVYLLILPIMFLISCSDDTVEEMGGSNHVLLERYPQEVINISMDNPESFASFNKTSVTRSSELLKDSVWSSGNGHTLIYETNEHIPTQGLMRYIYLGSILQGGIFTSDVRVATDLSTERQTLMLLKKILSEQNVFFANQQ